jgi:hypothetical protein
MKFGVQSGNKQAYKFCMQMFLYITTENAAKWMVQNFVITSETDNVLCNNGDINYGRKP